VQFLLIPDSFKGSLSATEVTQIMSDCIEKVLPRSNHTTFPFSDGGEGALDTLVEKAAGKLIFCDSVDALNRKINKPYFMFEKEATAWIELSQCAGLVGIEKKRQNPLNTSTLGVGHQIKHALDLGCRKIILGIGGSATHDLGAGIFVALGGQLLDHRGHAVFPSGGNLNRVYKIDNSLIDSRIEQTEFVIACDVNNPLLGEKGAAYVYATQKGASSNMIKTLETNGAHLIQLIEHLNGQRLNSIEGGGAAGGVAAGLKGLLDAQITNGFDLLSKKTALEKALQKATIIFTGEGRFDGQSAAGKLPHKIAQWGDEQKKITFIFAGSVDPLVEQDKLSANIRLINCKPEHQNTEEAMKFAKQNLQNRVLSILNELKKLD
jgi:glycerate kinase